MSYKLKDAKICSECGKEKERCRVVHQEADGTLIYVCRQCWRELDYDMYMYEHRVERNAN